MIQISQVDVDPELVDDEGPEGSDAEYDLTVLPDYDDAQFELPDDYEYTEEDDEE